MLVANLCSTITPISELELGMRTIRAILCCFLIVAPVVWLAASCADAVAPVPQYVVHPRRAADTDCNTTTLEGYWNVTSDGLPAGATYYVGYGDGVTYVTICLNDDGGGTTTPVVAWCDSEVTSECTSGSGGGGSGGGEEPPWSPTPCGDERDVMRAEYNNRIATIGWVPGCND